MSACMVAELFPSTQPEENDAMLKSISNEIAMVYGLPASILWLITSSVSVQYVTKVTLLVYFYDMLLWNICNCLLVHLSTPNCCTVEFVTVTA